MCKSRNIFLKTRRWLSPSFCFRALVILVLIKICGEPRAAVVLWSNRSSMLVGRRESVCWGLMFCRPAKPLVSERITLSRRRHLCLVITPSAENMTRVFIHEEFYVLNGFLNIHLRVFCLRSFHVTHRVHVKMEFLSSHFSWKYSLWVAVGVSR